MTWAYSSLLCNVCALIMLCSISLEAINMSRGTWPITRKSVCTYGILLMLPAKLLTSFANKGVAVMSFTLSASKLQGTFAKLFYVDTAIWLLFLLDTLIFAFWPSLSSRVTNAVIVIIMYKLLWRANSLNIYYGTLTSSKTNSTSFSVRPFIVAINYVSCRRNARTWHERWSMFMGNAYGMIVH